MADTAILMSIGDMIDLSIGTPEVGVVDFNMLQTVLHCLAQQLRILGKNVELRGSLASLPYSRENTQTIDIREFSIDTSEEIPTKKSELLPSSPPRAETILVVERVKRTDSPDRSPERKGFAPPAPESLSGAEASLVTRSTFDVLEKAVIMLEKAVDDMKANRPSATQAQGRSTDAQGLLTTSKFDILEKAVATLEAAVSEFRAQPPPDKQTQSTDPQNLVTLSKFQVLEKSIDVLDKAIGEIRQEQRPTDTTSQSTDARPLVTQSKFNVLEQAVATLENAITDMRAHRITDGQSQPSATQTQSFVTHSKFNMLEKAVSVLEKALGEYRTHKPTETQDQPTDAQSVVTVGKFNVLERALDVLGKTVEGIKAQQAHSGLAGTLSLVTVSKFNLLEKAVDEMRAQQGGAPPGTQIQPTGTKPLVTLSKFNVLERAVEDIRTQRPGAGSETAGARPPEPITLVSLSKFNLLQKTVDEIKGRVFSSIPKNETLLEEVRSQTNIKAIQDMWQSLNVQSRLEAAEEGIAKLSSLVEDLIMETSELQDATESRTTKIQAAAKSQTAALPAAAAAPPPAAAAPPPRAATPPPPAPASPRPVSTPRPKSAPSEVSKEDLAAAHELIAQLRNDVDALVDNFFELAEEVQKVTMPEAATETEVAPGTEQAAPAQPPDSSPAPAAAAQSKTVQEKPTRLSALTQGLGDRVNNVERKMKECCEKINKVEGVVQDQLNSFQDQLEYLLKKVTGLSTELGSGKLSPDLIKDLQGLMALFQTVQDMQAQLKKVHDTAIQLAAEKEDRQHYLNTLLEQIELLKTIKLDREDMVEAMADKADLRMLSRKVSHDQFESACDDLSKGLDQALSKLNMQEALWQQALDDIQREIETKLDKMELSPVKEFFNNKLKMLQENLKQMALLRREAEAAGTKKRLLRDVNCISCDANAVMPMDVANSLPLSKPMPATLSMKPYLSYELDAIRKSQQTQVPGTRNMHDWENIDKLMSQQAPKQPPKVRTETDKHICNRYCGGSHTTTTPAQRVARLGHFIKQWGPDVLPLSSGMAAGDDGKMYRVAGQEGAKPGGAAPESTNTPRPPKKPDTPKPTDTRPVGMSAECRCLDNLDQKADKKK